MYSKKSCLSKLSRRMSAVLIALHPSKNHTQKLCRYFSPERLWWIGTSCLQGTGVFHKAQYISSVTSFWRSPLSCFPWILQNYKHFVKYTCSKIFMKECFIQFFQRFNVVFSWKTTLYKKCVLCGEQRFRFQIYYSQLLQRLLRSETLVNLLLFCHLKLFDWFFFICATATCELLRLIILE